MFIHTMNPINLYFQGKTDARKKLPRKHIPPKAAKPDPIDIFVSRLFVPQHLEYRDSAIGKKEDADKLFEGEKRELTIGALEASIADKEDKQTRKPSWYQDLIQEFHKADNAPDIIKHLPTEILLELEARLNRRIDSKETRSIDGWTFHIGLVGQYKDIEEEIKELEEPTDDYWIQAERFLKREDRLHRLKKYGTILTNETLARTAVREKLLLDNEEAILKALFSERAVASRRPPNQVTLRTTRKRNILEVPLSKLRAATQSVTDYIASITESYSQDQQPLADMLVLNFHETLLCNQLLSLGKALPFGTKNKYSIFEDETADTLAVKIVNFYYSNEEEINKTLVDHYRDDSEVIDKMEALSHYEGKVKEDHEDPEIGLYAWNLVHKAYPYLRKERKIEIIELKIQDFWTLFDKMLELHGVERQAA